MTKTAVKSRVSAATLTEAERIKFELLDQGLAISAEAQAYIDERNSGRPMTPADYASTSGIILALADDVWVNAPIAEYNPNFVDRPTMTLELGVDGRLRVRGAGLESPASFWLPPSYHGQLNERGEPYNTYAFTHGDRVRIAPIEGCAMACHFCNLPYEFRYRRKDVAALVDSVARAITDEVQPARHVLISGGTPRPADYEYVQSVYEAVITSFPDTPIDVMMVPADGLLDIAWLDQLGVHELSVNVEIFNAKIARRIMRRKADQGLERYLDFLESAAEEMGPGRVRSMLMAGIEPMADTLAGVEAIADRGCVPVLSPFRPDPATPMVDVAPPTRAAMQETYLRAQAIVADRGIPLGPSCVPCTHNTMTLSDAGSGDARWCHEPPIVV